LKGIDFMEKNHSEDKKNIEIWEDLVYIKDLVLALIICMLTTFGGYMIAPNESPKPLLFGIVGAFIGFIIASLIIKPKRDFEENSRELV
jgi:uncharacterized membrane protein